MDLGKIKNMNVWINFIKEKVNSSLKPEKRRELMKTRILSVGRVTVVFNRSSLKQP